MDYIKYRGGSKFGGWDSMPTSGFPGIKHREDRIEFSNDTF